jgi:hypothetical protein
MPGDGVEIDRKVVGREGGEPTAAHLHDSTGQRHRLAGARRPDVHHHPVRSEHLERGVREFQPLGAVQRRELPGRARDEDAVDLACEPVQVRTGRGVVDLAVVVEEGG